jgi:hypothetical protein
MIDSQETSGCRQTRGTQGYTLTRPHPTLNFITERAENRLIAQGWVVNKICFVTIYTGACITVARPDFVERNTKRKQSQRYRLTTAPGESLPILKKPYWN